MLHGGRGTVGESLINGVKHELHGREEIAFNQLKHLHRKMRRQSHE